MNAVIYARFSSSSQREESIDTQIRECMLYAHRNKMVVIKSYQDKAKSGRTANRPAFQRMIKDAEDRKFEAVILYTLDRFARNRFDAAYYKAKLKECGVKVYYAKQDLGDGPEAILIESLMEGYAEYYSASLSRAVKAGQEENALHCKHAGGLLPYGLKVDDAKNIIEVPEEAHLVRQAFEMYAAGKSKEEIANYFNAQGHRTRKGQKFRGGTFDTWFTQERYIGYYIFGTHRVENGGPQIINKSLWDRVQLRVKEVHAVRAKYKAKEIYLLTPKVVCGCCGAPMYGESGTSRNGTVHQYYKCITQKKHRGECTKRTERKEEIETRVISMVEEYLLTDENIKWIAHRCVQIMENDVKNDPERLELKDRLNELNRALTNGWKAVENGYTSPAFSAHLMEYEAEKQEIEKQIAIIEAEDVPLTEEAIEFFLYQFKAHKLEHIDYERFICEGLINKVVLTDTDGGTHISVLCNVTNKQKKSEPDGSDIQDIVDITRQYPNRLHEFCKHFLVACGRYYNRGV